MVFDHTKREVGEDWSQGGETLAVCYFSNGGGGGSEETVPSHFGADRTVVATPAADENGMKIQNVEISVLQKQGGWSWYVAGRQQ